VGAEQALHHVGGVGANHQQFAVRHVDDAHDAVGNGQAECRQQQDRAERQAGEDGGQGVAPGQAAFDGLERLDGGFAYRLVVLVGRIGQRQQQAAYCRRLHFGQCRHGGQTDGRVGVLQRGLGVRRGQQFEDLRIALGSLGLGQYRCQFGADIALQFAGRCQAHTAVRVEQFEGGQRVGQFAAQAVVDRDRIGAVGQFDDLAAEGIERLLPIENEQRIVEHVQAAVGHRLQQLCRARLGRSGKLLDGLDLVGIVVSRQLPDQRRIGGGRGR
jgi:hypothetical protein